MARSAWFALLFALPLAAQQQPGLGAWWDSPIAKDLNLSEDQSRQIRAVVRESRPRLIDSRASVQKAEGEFQDVFNEDVFDQRRAAEVADRVAMARAELAKATMQMTVRLRAVLTADQWRELQRRRIQAQPGPANRGRQPAPPGNPPPPAGQ